MSRWIRIVPTQPWHRVNEHDVRHAVDDGVLEALCGEPLPVVEGWEVAEDDGVGPDDQHRWCHDRAEREHYWKGRLAGGTLPEMLGSLAWEAAPDLGSVAVEARPIEGLSVVLLEAEGVIGTFEGSGTTVRDAAGDLLATMEAAARAS